MKYHYSWRQFTYFVVLNQTLEVFASRFKSYLIGRSTRETKSGGEFGWGGTSVKR
jgi:hypothetical protein